MPEQETNTDQLAAAALLAPAPAPIAGRVKRRLMHSARPPKPAPGLELLGPMEDSGFEQTPFLVRRPDGQIVQLPELLYLVLEGTARVRNYGRLARDVTERLGAQIEADGARFLVDKKLKPLGLVGSGPVPTAQPNEQKPGD